MNIEKFDLKENIDKDLDGNLDKAFKNTDFEGLDDRFKSDIKDIFSNSSVKFDPENPKDSLKGAIDQDMTNMIDKNLKNLGSADREELKDIQKKALKSGDLNDMMEFYSEMKSTLGTLNGKMGARAQIDQQTYQNLQERYSKEQLEFLQKLQDGIKKDQEIAEKRRDELKRKQAELGRQENVERNNLENDLDDMLKYI